MQSSVLVCLLVLCHPVAGLPFDREDSFRHDATRKLQMTSDVHSHGCVDAQWSSSTFATCQDYATGTWFAPEPWCTSDGGYGPGWNAEWGIFDDWQRLGLSAAQACCACGGGNRDRCWPTETDFKFHGVKQHKGHSKPVKGDTVFNFNGVNAYIDLGDTNFGGDMTIAALIKVRSANRWSRVVEMGNGMEKQMMVFGFRGTSGKMTFESFETGVDKGGVTAPQKLPLNQWMHVAVTISVHGKGATARLYQNGVEVANGEVFASPVMKRVHSFIGRSIYPQDQYFNGEIANFRIYSRVLSLMQVGALAHPNGEEIPSASFVLDSIALFPTYHDGATVVDSDLGGLVLDLDGSSAYVDIGDTQVGVDFSIAAHIKVHNREHKNARVVDMTAESYDSTLHSTMHLALHERTGKLKFETTTSEGNWNRVMAAQSLPQNEWVHVAVTVHTRTTSPYVRGVLVILYQDGVEVARNDFYAVMVHNELRVNSFLGRSAYAGNEFFDGQISLFKIFDRTLSAGEIASLAAPLSARVDGVYFSPCTAEVEETPSTPNVLSNLVEGSRFRICSALRHQGRCLYSHSNAAHLSVEPRSALDSGMIWEIYPTPYESGHGTYLLRSTRPRSGNSEYFLHVGGHRSDVRVWPGEGVESSRWLLSEHGTSAGVALVIKPAIRHGHAPLNVGSDPNEIHVLSTFPEDGSFWLLESVAK